MRDDEKRKVRETKRAVKREGNRKRRRALKRQLDESPEDAPFATFDFGRASSKGLNDPPKDRKRDPERQPERKRAPRDEEE